MCGDDDSSSITDRAVLIFLSVPILLLFLAMAIMIVIIILFCRKKEEKLSVQVDRKENIYTQLDTGNSRTARPTSQELDLMV